jgi:hypothetical protein
MQNDLGLTEEAARYAVESWAMVLDKMPPQQIQQPIIKLPTTISRNQQPILESTHPQPREISQTRQKLIIKPPKRSFLKTAGIAIGGLVLVLMTQQIFGNQEARQIDYTELETLLKAQDFRAADEETDKVILAVAKREKQGSLRIEDAEKFPCKELRSIDQLWLKYGGGKFGISVQLELYQKAENVGLEKLWDDTSFIRAWNRREALRLFSPSLLSRHAECNT